MRKILRVILLVGSTIGLLIGCSQNPAQEHYYVLVVEGQDNLIEKFDKYASVKNPVIKIDYYKNINDAKKQYPDYKIAESPIVFIFSGSEKNIRKLVLKTTDVERSLRKIQSLKDT